MASRLRLGGFRAPSDPRWTVGLMVSSDCNRLDAALVASVGRGVQLKTEIVGTSTRQLPGEAGSLFSRLTCPGVDPPDSDAAGRITSLKALLAESEALAIDGLLSECSIAATQVHAVGVHDPGLWSGGGYLGLCDAARLAELTGMNVVDAFPARDVARGGQGGPLTVLGEWVLLNSADRNRVLLDLGRSVRLSYLPCDSGNDPCSRILSFEVGPGMLLLDQLTQRLTGGEHAFDPGGRFAVQGRRITELLEHWLADPYFRRPLPRWQPRGIRPERFLVDAIGMAVDLGWSVRDILCTATHFVAETTARAISGCLPDNLSVDQIVLTGGGQHNGMLLREIGNRLSRIPMFRVSRFGNAGAALGPACVALMALFHLDQVAANYPTVTGTEASRVLGRLTPGSPKNWQSLLSSLTSRKPGIRLMRRAQ